MEHHRYVRPANPHPLLPHEKAELLRKYFAYYERLAQDAPELLNVKLERSAVSDVLDEIGTLLLERSQQLAREPGPVKDFLDTTELPDCLQARLPDEFRAFCLTLNALKQWVAAESAATDRYLLGGTARKQCRQMADHCLATGQPIDGSKVELHHPARDGRPSIPLSKTGHDAIESSAQIHDEPVEAALRELKREGSRSWVMLRRGCQALLGETVDDSTSAVLASSKTFARKAVDATGLDYEELIEWLDERELGQ
jgi:hypothetical protein